MATSRCRNLMVIALAVLATAGTCAHGEEAAPAAAAPSQEWVHARRAEFQEYRFTRAGEARVALTLEPNSLLNWSNAERGTDHGGLFLWTDAGRPQMIACAFKSGALKHEFHSLCTDAIEAERRGERVHRFGPGIEWVELAGEPEPARSRPLRLTQMRRLAGRFRVTVGHKDWAETRLLPQPVFRSPASPDRDTAVFVFVQGTDPECVLVLESDGEAWRYAMARQTKFGLKAELDDNLVREWKPNHRPLRDPESPFLVVTQAGAASDD